MEVQGLDNVGAGLTPAQRDDVSADAVVKRSALLLVSLRSNHKIRL
jgi:hypothetical protein